MNFDPALLTFFEQHQLKYDYHEHPPIFTVAEWEALKQTLPGKQTKNLFLTDKRGQYYLVCLESSKRLQINQFRKLIGAKDMTFASPEEMQEILGLTPGSVSFFGLANWATNPPSCGHLPWQGEKQLHLFLDQDLRASNLVWRHPNRNDATIVIDHATLVRFLEIVEVEVEVIEVGKAECYIV